MIATPRVPQPVKVARCAYCAHSGGALRDDVLERCGEPIRVRVCADTVGCYRRVREQRDPRPPVAGALVA